MGEKDQERPEDCGPDEQVLVLSPGVKGSKRERRDRRNDQSGERSVPPRRQSRHPHHPEDHHHYRIDHEQDPQERRHRVRPTQATKEGEVVPDERRGTSAHRPGGTEGEVSRERRQEPLCKLQEKDDARQPRVRARAAVKVQGAALVPPGFTGGPLLPWL